ncbi:hypothetical protein EET67_04950 [Pseudaminobacter arsenicus]|uniref:Uncharacterized protein n=1 Tax=Borborobacter arsenicus TaxID=1851146 RepID=A0A432V9Y1_9HYPH|nr:hypothetical protein [Pseudaminobacter arsenicus]RUM98992.1 hypothetical protein EET67_04950 [Pseudaminobacter arsenicus]
MSDTDYAFAKGDVVRLRATPEIAGQVVSEEDWGGRYAVRLQGSIDVEWFEVEELEFVPLPPAVAAAMRAADSNVVQVDFTKRTKLTKTSKTGGAA